MGEWIFGVINLLKNLIYNSLWQFNNSKILFWSNCPLGIRMPITISITSSTKNYTFTNFSFDLFPNKCNFIIVMWNPKNRKTVLQIPNQRIFCWRSWESLKWKKACRTSRTERKNTKSWCSTSLLIHSHDVETTKNCNLRIWKWLSMCFTKIQCL